jgi:methylase of polypeptide subunit release factors
VSPISRGEQHLFRTIDVSRPSPTELRALTEAIRAGNDPLGEAFCRIRTPRDRRADGATYTPGPIVDAMLDWGSSGPPIGRVIDPGSGSGRFAVAAGLEFPQAQILAVELDPLAALLTRANLAVHGIESRSRVLVQDYRTFNAPKSNDRTLYVGNPPYVRHHQIAPQWKAWLTSTARAQGLAASQLAGLHIHFFLATVVSAAPGDRGVFITSSEWLDVNYGSLLRELVLDGLGGDSIHVIAPEAKPFDDAQTTGAITCFEVGSTPLSVRFRRVKRVAELGNLGGGHAVRRERLAQARRWTPLLRASRRAPQGYVELGELCRVHRGAVTGSNRVWVSNPGQSGLPDSVVFRSVTRARELFEADNTLVSSEGLRAVIDIPRDLDELAPDERRVVERFLRKAKRLGAHSGYVAQHRQAWWAVGLRAAAPILTTYMARRPPAIVRNLAAARHINVAHGLYPRQPVAGQVLDRLAAVLRGSVHVRHGRTYAGGLTKFEPGEMERLLIPDVTQRDS